MDNSLETISELSNQTRLHPLGVTAVIVLGIVMLIVKRRYAVIPMILMACFISSAQRLVVFGLDFSLLRIMVLFGWVRLLSKNETKNFKWKKIDTVMILWSISSIITYTLCNGTFSAFVNRLGVSFDTVGMYFLFRCLIQNWDDVEYMLRGFILAGIPVALAFAVEQSTGRNAFAFLGGVPAITVIREGKLRCQGPFSHAILAGCFWASLMPLFAAFWWKSAKHRIWAVIGLASSFIIVICCASSTPLMAAIFGIVGGCMFYLRKQMRIVRWGILLTLIALHIVMKAPVWNLIARVNIISGSTGYHRFVLIDEAINHFSEWWLIGTRSIDNWRVWAGDITNHFILEGVHGGLLTLALFIAIIVLSFGAVGRIWRFAGKNKYYTYMAWALGVSLFTHIMSFISVSYFGQILMVWYLLLAIIASLDPGKSYSGTVKSMSNK